MVEPYQLLQI